MRKDNVPEYISCDKASSAQIERETKSYFERDCGLKKMKAVVCELVNLYVFSYFSREDAIKLKV